MTLFRNFVLAGALSLSLAACQTSMTASHMKTDDVFRIDEIPHAQLSGNVVPQSYRVDMKMDPDAEGFSGVVQIDVEIIKPTNKIWLHGKHMTVTSATAMIGGEPLPLVFTELTAEQAPSGIANLTSETVLPAGKTTLTLAYETPYNQALNSAYQVKRGGEGYIVTQFERDRSHVANEGLELLVLGDEIRLRVHFDRSTLGARYFDADQALGRSAAGLLGGRGEALGAQPVHRHRHVAIGFGQRLLAIHHARAALFAQVLYRSCRDLGHVVGPYLSRIWFWTG